MTVPVLWQSMTWEEIATLRDSGMHTAILPVGATEQDGPHLFAMMVEDLSRLIRSALTEQSPLPQSHFVAI